MRAVRGRRRRSSSAASSSNAPEHGGSNSSSSRCRIVTRFGATLRAGVVPARALASLVAGRLLAVLAAFRRGDTASVTPWTETVPLARATGLSGVGNGTSEVLRAQLLAALGPADPAAPPRRSNDEPSAEPS